MNNNLKEMTLEQLIELSNRATEAYDEGKPFMSDEEYDEIYFEIESRGGGKNSPTESIHYRVVSNLEKIEHDHPMLSLDKTKDIKVLESFCHNRDIVGMLKMDGLTCSLRYEGGILKGAETRGDGKVGENILHNALVIKNIPKIIPYLDKITIDGEIICKKEDFKEFSEQYKNPRNFAAGSIRLLNNAECASRNLSFIAWDIISNTDNTLTEKLGRAEKLGFEVVPYCTVSGSDNIELDIIPWLKNKAENYPIDGLVFKLNNCEEYYKLGYNDHHFKGGIAYKFYDETYSTKLLYLSWDISRTGTLTPVAVFEGVDINGSRVTRASLHNLTIMEEVLGIPYEGQELEVFKANEVIPQVYSAVKNDYPMNIISLPTHCPSCNSELSIKQEYETKTLCCNNPICKAKVISKLDYFASKGCMDIDGLSYNTLVDLYDCVGVRTYRDLYLLNRDVLTVMPNFGETSINNLLSAIEKSRYTTFTKFLTSIGIPGIGWKQAEQLSTICTNWTDFRNKVYSNFDWGILERFGQRKSEAINSFNFTEADLVEPFLIFEEEKKTEVSSNTLSNVKVVITGSLNYFKNRNELRELIERNSGIVQDGIKKDTTYLINNDINSNSSKNKKAKELGIKIISEEEFLDKFNLKG